MNRKVYKMKRAGSLSSLKMLEEELPQPEDSQVTIEIKAIGLNFADVFTVLGLYMAAPKKNVIPGLEFSGVVTARGKNAKAFNIGDRVYGVTKFGAYVSHINLNEFYVLPLPDSWSFEEGASFIVQALTAYYGLVKLGEVNKDKTVLIHSAAGGVGLYANRIAKKYGAYTIGTVGSPAKLPLLKEEGYDRAIVRGKNIKEDIISALEGRKLNIVMDAIGGRMFKLCYKMLAPTGRMIVYGAGAYSTGSKASNYFKLAYTYFTRPKLDPLRMIEQNKSVLPFNLIWLYENGGYLKEMLNELIALNLPKPVVSRVFPFGRLPEAVLALKSGKTTGKVVVTAE